jgi:hypothetical protein
MIKRSTYKERFVARAKFWPTWALYILFFVAGILLWFQTKYPISFAFILIGPFAHALFSLLRDDSENCLIYVEEQLIGTENDDTRFMMQLIDVIEYCKRTTSHTAVNIPRLLYYNVLLTKMREGFKPSVEFKKQIINGDMP